MYRYGDINGYSCRTLRFLISFHRSTKCCTISSTTGPTSVMWSYDVFAKYSHATRKTEHKNENTRISHRFPVYKDDNVTYIMPWHTRRLKDGDFVANKIIDMLKVKETRVVVVLSCKERACEMGGVDIGKRAG